MPGLFDPITVRGVRLRNRIVASPMWQYAGVDGAPTTTHVVHLGRLAEGGAGLVLQDGTTVDRRGRGTTGDLGLWDDTPHRTPQGPGRRHPSGRRRARDPAHSRGSQRQAKSALVTARPTPAGRLRLVGAGL